MKTRTQSRIDLRKENPHGRLDVLAATVIEKFAQTRAPEFLPIIEQHREILHAALNEELGPHVVHLGQVFKAAEPYMPLLNSIVKQITSTKPEGGKA